MTGDTRLVVSQHHVIPSYTSNVCIVSHRLYPSWRGGFFANIANSILMSTIRVKFKVIVFHTTFLGSCKPLPIKSSNQCFWHLHTCQIRSRTFLGYPQPTARKQGSGLHRTMCVQGKAGDSWRQCYPSCQFPPVTGPRGPGERTPGQCLRRRPEKCARMNIYLRISAGPC